MYNNVSRNYPHNAERTKHESAKETIQVCHVISLAAADADGNRLVNAAPGIMPHSVWLAQEQPNPDPQNSWLAGTKWFDYIYQVGEQVPMIETHAGWNYRVRVHNQDVTPLVLAEEDMLILSPNVDGQLEKLATPSEATVADLADLKNVLFLVDYETDDTVTTWTIPASGSALVYVRRI